MKVKKSINLIDPHFRLVTLQPGDEVPDWAVITNPSVLDEGNNVEVVSVVTESVVGSMSVDYSDMKNDDLRALLEQRGLDTNGKKSDLVTRLLESDNAEIDVWAMTSEELHQYAATNEIDISGASSDVEIAALIEQSRV